MIKKLALFIAVSNLCAAAPAMAQSYNFAGISSDGQNYQGATLGPMTLSSQNGTLIYTSAYGGGLFDGNGASSDITMTFSVGLSSIAVRAGDGSGDLDAFGLIAYEFGTNSLLGTFYTPQFGGPNEPEWYTLTLSGIGNIGKVVFDPCNGGTCPGTLGGLGGVVVTDINLNVTSVPEPSTYALMFGGLGIIGWVGRRRRSA